MRRRFLSVRLSPEERAQVDELAALWGCPKADVLRSTFRVFLLVRGDQVFLNNQQTSLKPED
jgi:hypothetical protein